MWNLYRLLPPEGPNYTRIYRGRGELIDHIFASHRLVNPDNLPTVEVIAATPLPSMDDQPAPATALPSDHAAVVATFEVNRTFADRVTGERTSSGAASWPARVTDSANRSPTFSAERVASPAVATRRRAVR
jgi:hypothetical protein